MKYSSLDTETPEGDLALICTPTESYNIETWEDFTSRFMVVKNLKTVFFCWNLRFDAQAILKLLPYDKLIELWKAKDNRIEYDGYRITYIPKKMLIISIIEGKKGAIHLYDASQYYGNKSLNSQAKKYLDEKKLDTISGEEIGKSLAYYKGNYKEIVKYCKKDAELTLKLAKLSMNNIRKLGFNPSNPISPASISRKYQRKRGFPTPLKEASNMELKVNAIALLAYKGGIFATYQRGMFNQPLYDYDVNSCYPNIMIDLPDWRNGEFEFIEGNEPEKYEYGWILVEVDSEYLPHQKGEHYTIKEIYEDVGNWDMKYTAKKVTYPTGLRVMVITTDEYRWLKKEGEKIKYLGEGMGWVRKTHNYPNPFAWMKEMFKKRKDFKKTDPALAQTMKLLMNSLYGSTVQRKNGIGDLSNFCYGSYITGRARKQMFIVVKANKEAIVNIATDGILSLEKLSVSKNFLVGDNLGEWEYHEYTKGLVIGNGIRQLWKADGTFVTHARGITADRKYDLLLNLVRCFHSRLSFFPVGKTRVIQLGTMVNAHIKWKKEHLNTFIMQSRVLNVNTDKKREWEREYKNFGDLLKSEPMGGKPLKI
ncbi:hypothetical protein KAW50_05025 [candidate division WOR-3 bacterium]|nr:hypothetical protein [candidate division WOR-3 bacterium]